MYEVMLEIPQMPNAITLSGAKASGVKQTVLVSEKDKRFVLNLTVHSIKSKGTVHFLACGQSLKWPGCSLSQAIHF